MSHEQPEPATGRRGATHDTMAIPLRHVRAGMPRDPERRSGDEPSESGVTLGVSVPVPEPYGSELQKWRGSFGDEQAPFIPTHVTLLGPTGIRTADVAAVMAHLEQVAQRHRRFRMVLAGTGTFRPRSDVVFVRVVNGGEQCAQIERSVRSGPLAREVEFGYHPHVTVGHDLDQDALDRAIVELGSYHAEFDVDGFSLYTLGSDGHWRVERSFPLGAPRDDVPRA